MENQEWEQLKAYIKGIKSQALNGSELQTMTSYILKYMEDLEK